MGNLRKWDLPPLPMTQGEIKQLLRNKQDQDEAEAIKYLAIHEDINSVASKIYRAWGLDRRLIKDCHVAMSRSRSLQVTFNNIVGATRFKVMEGSQLRRAKCQKEGCGAIDYWEHFRKCYQVPDIGKQDRNKRIPEIVKVCERAEVKNPGRPRPSEEQYLK